MPIQGYTPNKNLIKIAAGSTDNWDVWYNDVMDKLDEPSILYQVSAAQDLTEGDVAAILDDGYGAKKAYLASGSYTFGDPLGIVTADVTSGQSVRMVMSGWAQSANWSFGASDKLAYLSPSGTVTTTQTGSEPIIGFVLSSTTIYFNPATGFAGSAGPYFDIDYLENSARLSTTGLTADRVYTFPDADTKLVGESASATITTDHDYSGGTLRLPTNAGAPTGANDEGDVAFDTANDNLYVGLGGSAWTPVAGGPVFSAHKNGTNQASVGSGTWTLVTFGTEDFDTADAYDISTSRFTPLAAGKYLLTSHITWTNFADTAQAGISIYKNGAQLRTVTARSPGTGSISVSITAIVDMNGSTDYVEIHAYHDSGAPRDIDGATAATSFAGSKIA